jgi:hypothetical protein
MMPGRRKNEVLEDILSSGGASPYTSEERTRAKWFPSSFNRIVRFMLKIKYRLQEMVEEGIPQAFPITEQKGRGDPRYTHSSAEMLHARPVTLLKDANLALEVCIEIKQLLSTAKIILASFYPKRIENSSFTTEVQDDFRSDVEQINGYLENIEKIHNNILRSKGSGLSQTIDFRGLEKLRNHLIKIGYETSERGKELIEVFPNVLTVRKEASGPRTLPNEEMRSLGDSSMEDGMKEAICKLSDRFFESIGEDEP